MLRAFLTIRTCYTIVTILLEYRLYSCIENSRYFRNPPPSDPDPLTHHLHDPDVTQTGPGPLTALQPEAVKLFCVR